MTVFFDLTKNVRITGVSLFILYSFTPATDIVRGIVINYRYDA